MHRKCQIDGHLLVMLASGRHSGWSWPLQGAVHPDSCGYSQCLWESRAHALRGLHFCIMHSSSSYVQYDLRVYVFVHVPRACSALCNLLSLPPMAQADASTERDQSVSWQDTTPTAFQLLLGSGKISSCSQAMLSQLSADASDQGRSVCKTCLQLVLALQFPSDL